MQLVNKMSQTVIIEFDQGKPIFHDRLLQAEMETQGIFIPPYLRSRFSGKHTVFPSDPLFEVAFYEVYCVFTLPQNLFEWQRSKS